MSSRGHPPPPYDTSSYPQATTEDAILPEYSELFPNEHNAPPMDAGAVSCSNNSIRNKTKRFVTSICKPVAAVVMVFMLAVLPSSMVIMGSIFLRQCTIRPFIPIFILVFGGVCLAISVVHFIKMIIFHLTKDTGEVGSKLTHAKRNSCEAAAVVFLFIWFLIGTFYVFHTWGEWSDKGRVSCSGNNELSYCCDPGIMYFAVIVVSLIFTITAFSIVIGCCCFCFISFLSYFS